MPEAHPGFTHCVRFGLRLQLFVWIIFGAVMTVAPTFSRAETRESLVGDLKRAASKVIPFKLGYALRLDGAVVDGSTLRIKFSAEQRPRPGQSFPTLLRKMFEGACVRPDYADLIKRGAVIVYVLKTVDKPAEEFIRFTAGSCRFEADGEAMAADLERAASRIVAFPLGYGLQLAGARAEGTTITIRINSERAPDKGEDFPALIRRMFASECISPDYADLLIRGAAIAYKLEIPGAPASEVLRLSARSCGFDAASPRKSSPSRKVLENIRKFGLEKVLLEIAATYRAGLVFDSATLVRIEPYHRGLNISIKLNPLFKKAGGDLRQKFVSFVCNDPNYEHAPFGRCDDELPAGG